jgi:hypothetical protein
MEKRKMMKNVIAFLAAVLLGGAVSAGPLELDATFYPENALPGAWSFVQLVLTNDSDAPVLLGNQLRVRIRGQEGEPVKYGLSGRTEAHLNPAGILGPGESVRHILAWGGPWPDGNGWICDARLAEPGSRDLVFEVSWTSLDAEDVAEIAELRADELDGWADFAFYHQERAADWAQSAPVRHQILEPRGLDRQVWDDLRQRSGGAWTVCNWTAEIGLEIYLRYPQSGYTPDALLAIPANTTGVQGYLKDAIRRYPKHVLTADLASRLYAIQSGLAFGDPDLANTERLYAEAMDTLMSALERGRDMPPFWRERLQEKLDAHDQEGTIRWIGEGRAASAARKKNKE